jgi:hypothetical protein
MRLPNQLVSLTIKSCGKQVGKLFSQLLRNVINTFSLKLSDCDVAGNNFEAKSPQTNFDS